MFAYSKNFVKFDRINAGKLQCNYSRQRINTARVSVCLYKTLVTSSLSVCVYTHVSTSESWLTFNHVGND